MVDSTGDAGCSVTIWDPGAQKQSLSRWGIFVEIANNTLYVYIVYTDFVVQGHMFDVYFI